MRIIIQFKTVNLPSIIVEDAYTFNYALHNTSPKRTVNFPANLQENNQSISSRTKEERNLDLYIAVEMQK